MHHPFPVGLVSLVPADGFCDSKGCGMLITNPLPFPDHFLNVCCCWLLCAMYADTLCVFCAFKLP